MVLIDSYSETNRDNQLYIAANAAGWGWAFGQSFTMQATNHILTSAKFYLSKEGAPDTNVYARLYAHNGVYGTNGVPTGAVLVTSDAVATSGIAAGFNLVTFTFSGAEQYEMQADAKYCIGCGFASAGLDGSNKLWFGIDQSSPSHSGNYFASTGEGAWGGDNTSDASFYVYGDAVAGGVTVKKSSSVVSTMMQMLNSKMLFSQCNPYSLKV